MPISLKNAAFSAMLLGLFASSCVSRGDYEKLEGTVQSLKSENVQLWINLHKVASQSETLERTFFSREYCKVERNDRRDKNGKLEPSSKFIAEINEFLGSVQANVPEVCTEINMQNAMTFLRTQPYANAFFRPGESLDAMHIARQEYLIDLLAPKFLHPSTRLLILVQPAEETEAARAAALQLGEKFKAMLKAKFSPQINVAQQIGPHLLPCRLRREVQRLFNSVFDNTLPGEPKEGDPRIRIWLFVSDC